MRAFTASPRSLSRLVPVTLALALVIGTNLGNVASAHAATSVPSGYVTVASAFTGGKLMGQHAPSGQMAVALVLRPSNAAQIDSLLAALYDPANSQYHQWLPKGQFLQRFAPTPGARAQATSFLQQAGLTVQASSSPFLVRASGTAAQMEKAFNTHISDYRAVNGTAFYANDRPAHIPAALGGAVSGVLGLANTAREHGHFITTRAAAQKAGRQVPHYGAGPGGSGLTPAQTSSLYGADAVYDTGNSGKGDGATLAVFELSGYTPADITTYEQTFFGSSANVPLVDINVDGGPLTPICPAGDSCLPGPDFSGDIEVEADIETQIALAPKIDRILVYNAPNDFAGITTVDEYMQIAADDTADSISSSWGLCELDVTPAQITAESIAFKQMALQGQSMFTSSGDTGAFDCLRDLGSNNQLNVAVGDPASQPYVTGVGGTSFGTFDPGTDQSPSYPAGFETVWNPLDLCSGASLGGLNECLNVGSSGGGVSAFWPLPSYQHGPGVITSLSQKAPYCAFATGDQTCREAPDVSANADEFTPYAEFCTGDPTTTSTCASFSSTTPVPGWFGIGGTSLSSPLWSAIIALSDSVHHSRFGEANPGLYELFRRSNAYSTYFHDITGKNQTENNNGLYPVTPKYDMATGIGTPRISAIAKFSGDHD